MKKGSKVSPAIFAASALCFLLPFVTVSCGGTKVASFTGVQLATGMTVNEPQVPGGEAQPKKIDADPLSAFAGLCVLISLAMSFIATGRLAIWPAIGGATGAVALLVMKSNLQNQLAKQANGLLQVNYAPGFVLALLCLIAAAAWNAYLFFQREQVDPAEDAILPDPMFGGRGTFHDTIADAPPTQASVTVETPPVTTEVAEEALPLTRASVEAPTLPSLVAPNPVPATGVVFCPHCGAMLNATARFCTSCGVPVGAAVPPAASVPVELPIVAAAPEPPVAIEPVVAPLEVPPPAPAPEIPVPVTRDYSIVHDPPREEAASVLAETPIVNLPMTVLPPLVTDRPRPAGKSTNWIALVLMIVLLIAAGTGWYFWGVDTVIVCAPYDCKAFLDGVELSPESPGRFTVPHMARGPHMLMVQKTGYSEVFQNLDFPLTSISEWVNVRLTPLPAGKKSF